MKPDELERFSRSILKHLERWGPYYACSGGIGFIVVVILLVCLSPTPGAVTTSDALISMAVGTLGFTAAALNQSIAWVRSFPERRHKKKLRRLREVKALETELGLDEHSSEMVH